MCGDCSGSCMVDSMGIVGSVDDAAAEIVKELKGLRREVSQQTKLLRLLLNKIEAGQAAQ